MKDIKSTLSTICGVLGVIGGAILALPQYGIEVPAIVKAVAGTFVAMSVGVIGYLTGKNPDGTAKTTDQIAKQLTEAKQFDAK